MGSDGWAIGLPSAGPFSPSTCRNSSYSYLQGLDCTHEATIISSSLVLPALPSASGHLNEISSD
jgi:hypothetical protein